MEKTLAQFVKQGKNCSYSIIFSSLLLYIDLIGNNYGVSCRHYCDDNATSETAMRDSKKCPAGFLCDEGLTGLIGATDCDPGYYCPEGIHEFEIFVVFYKFVYTNF